MLRLPLLLAVTGKLPARGGRTLAVKGSPLMAASDNVVQLVVGYRADTENTAKPFIAQPAQLDIQDAQIHLIDMHDSQACQTHFDMASYFDHLPQNCSLGATLLATAHMQSTQTFVQSNMSNVPDNTVCTAYKQTGGKGRGGNVWESPAGCLMFSIYKKVSIQGQDLPFIQYIATLAIVHAVQELAQQRLQGSGIDVRIKWPNDIYSGGVKIGGVLCHSTYRQKDFHVVIGVGLNLDNSQPTTCINDLVEQQRVQLGLPMGSASITREELLGCLLMELEAMLSTLACQGFQPLQEAYLHSWLHTNQQVTLLEGGQEISMTVVGLTKYGYLRAISHGEEFALHPDGNSFDFFNGLIRHKLE